MNNDTKYEFKGTPGEYKVTDTAFIYALHVRNGERLKCNRFQARVYPDYAGGVTEEEATATAILFAASPLLLSALIKAVEAIDQQNTPRKYSEYYTPDWYVEAKSAIEAAINSSPENLQP